MTTRKSTSKPTSGQRGAKSAQAKNKANKTIDLTAEDITKQDAGAPDKTEPVKKAPSPRAKAASTRTTRSTGAKATAAKSEAKASAGDKASAEPEAAKTTAAEKQAAKPAASTAKSATIASKSPEKSETSEKTEKLGKTESSETKAIKDSVSAKPEAKSAKSEAKMDEKKAAPKAAPTASAPKARGGFTGGLFGGVIGGAAILGLGYVGLQQGYVTLPQGANQQALQQVQDQQAGKITSVEQALADLEKQIAGLKDDSGLAPLNERIVSTEEAIAKVRDQIATLSGQVGSGQVGGEEVGAGQAGSGESSSAQVTETMSKDAASDADASGAESASQTEQSAGVVAELEALSTKLVGLTERLEGLEGLNAQFLEARDKISLLESQALEQAGNLQKQFEDAQEAILSSADRRIDNLVTDLSNMGEKIGAEAKSLASRVTSLEDNNLSEKMQSSARTIALAGLENAVASGRPFAAPLATFAEVAEGNEAVEALKAHAEKGAPTADKLAKEFRVLSGRLIKAADDAGSQSLLDKIMLNAQSLVRVRPVGEVEGESLSAKLARIEVRVQDGRHKEAAEEWKGLPDAAKTAGQSWADGLNARLAVDAAMQTIRTEFGKKADQTAQ